MMWHIDIWFKNDEMHKSFVWDFRFSVHIKKKKNLKKLNFFSWFFFLLQRGWSKIGREGPTGPFGTSHYWIFVKVGMWYWPNYRLLQWEFRDSGALFRWGCSMTPFLGSLVSWLFFWLNKGLSDQSTYETPKKGSCYEPTWKGPENPETRTEPTYS